MQGLQLDALIQDLMLARFDIALHTISMRLAMMLRHQTRQWLTQQIFRGITPDLQRVIVEHDQFTRFIGNQDRLSHGLEYGCQKIIQAMLISRQYILFVYQFDISLLKHDHYSRTVDR